MILCLEMNFQENHLQLTLVAGLQGDSILDRQILKEGSTKDSKTFLGAFLVISSHFLRSTEAKFS